MMADRDIPVYAHFDGDLKPLWDAHLRVEAFAGLTRSHRPRQRHQRRAGHAHVAGDAAWRSDFQSSVHLAGPKTIYDTATRILSEGGHTGRLADSGL